MSPDLTTETPLDRAIRIVGGVTNLAREMGTTAGTIVCWRHRGIPDRRVLKIETVTKKYGLKVDRTELAPDLYPPGDYREKARLKAVAA